MEISVQQLSKSGLFSGLPEDVLRAIAGGSTRRTLAAGEVLFRKGTPRDALRILMEGQVEIRSEEGETGDHLIRLGAGEILGEQALLEDAVHTSTAIALVETQVLEVPVAVVKSAMEASADTAITLLTRIASTIGRRLAYASTRDRGIGHSGVTRQEHDLLGNRDVPEDALYGVQTLRALDNFPITGIPLSHYPTLVRALAMVKQACARANREQGHLEPEVADAIDTASQEVIDGQWHGHFVVDMLQGGAGTSTNMNANEVIANRALELMGKPRGDYQHCHPNNHVNKSQSTNDVYPTALRIGTVFASRALVAAMTQLRDALHEKGKEFEGILKMGRTQLQDAVPMTLGQEFMAFADTTQEDIALLQDATKMFLTVNMGGTAIGTSINADRRYPGIVVGKLQEITGLEIALAKNLVAATPDTGPFVSFSGVLKRIAVKLSKMCNDLRLLASGPRCGLGEIHLPARAPGSSIMPGKVNPIIPEVVNQTAFQVIGNDLTITMAAEAGQLQLNVMEPVIAFNTFQSLDMLAAAIGTFVERCVKGITADADRCRDMVEHSIGIVTALVPVLGYERSGEVAKEALRTARPVRTILMEKGYLTEEELDRFLSPKTMTSPHTLIMRRDVQ